MKSYFDETSLQTMSIRSAEILLSEPSVKKCIVLACTLWTPYWPVATPVVGVFQPWVQSMGSALGRCGKHPMSSSGVLFAILLIPTRRMRATLEVLVLVAGSGHTDKCVLYLSLLVDLLFVDNVHLLVQLLARHLPINIWGFGCRLGTQTNGRAAINCAGNLLLHAGPRHASPNPSLPQIFCSITDF